MPVPPTSISAATITSQAMPIEMRIPVRMVGAAAGRITLNAFLKVATSNVRATVVKRIFQLHERCFAELAERRKAVRLLGALAEELRVLIVGGSDLFLRHCGEMPDAQEHAEEEEREQPRGERLSFAVHTAFLMAKLARYFSGCAGSNSLPITLILA